MSAAISAALTCLCLFKNSYRF